MAKLTLASLQSAFKQTSSDTGGNFYRFFDMPIGSQAEVRFLPDADENNPLGFLVEKVTHSLNINGEWKSIPCLSAFGKECPICEVSRRYYNAEDKENGKKYWKKRQHIGQVMIIKDPLPENPSTGENNAGKVMRIAIGFQLFQIIKTAFESGDLEEIPYAFNDGYNFIIKKQQQGEYATYALGSNFARKQTSLTKKQLAEIEENLIDLSTMLPQEPPLERVEEMLNAALTGEEYSETAKEKPAMTLNKKKVSTAVEEDEEEIEETVMTNESSDVEETDVDEPKASDILTRIRERRAAAAEAG